MYRILAQRLGCFIVELNKPFRSKQTPFSMGTRLKRKVNILKANEDPLKRIKSEPSVTSTVAIKEEDLKQSKSGPKVVGSQNKVEKGASSKCDTPLGKLKLDGILEIGSDELNLERTLMGGQSFRWTKKDLSSGAKSEAIFTGTVNQYVFQLWRLSDNQIAFRTLNKESEGLRISDKLAFLEDYFQLKHNLRQLYKEWSTKDTYLASRCKEYEGFRILRQDPVENVFCFICATNNNIKRISQMVDKLCQKFGKTLEPIQGDDFDQQLFLADAYYTFPTVERLAQEDVFQCLRYELGFGYRAKYIHETAKKLLITSQQRNMSSRDYLLSLRKLAYPETRQKLIEFQGIGRKVADCICLMSMDHLNSVPTDCHIYEIFRRNYMPCYAKTNLTETMHQKISDYFNDLHGPLAGWSTSVLFIAELKHLKAMEGEDSPKIKPKKKNPSTKKKPNE